MNRFLYTVGAVCLACAPVMSLDITVSSGDLAKSKPLIQNTSDKVLKLRGDIDVRDIIILREVSGTVSILDISEVNVKGYKSLSGDLYGQTSFEDGELPRYSFAGSQYREIKLPLTLKSIGVGAFSGSALTSVEIPPAVTSVGEFAFASCKDLETVVTKGNISFENGVFKHCGNLRKVEFGYEVTRIPPQMFDGCAMLNLTIPPTVSYIGDYSFRQTALKSADLSGVEQVGDYAFSDVESLGEITFNREQNLTLGKGAFFNCGGMAIYSKLFEEIPSMLFGHSIRMSAVNIDSEEVGEAAFANNHNLKTVILEASVKSIAQHAFRNNDSLSVVDVVSLNTHTPEVDRLSFSGLENEDGRYDIFLHVADGSEEVWKKHPVWSLFDITTEDVGVSNVDDAAADILVSHQGEEVIISCESGITSVEVYSTNGTKVYTREACGENHTIEGLDKGIYVLVVKSGAVVKLVKLIL